MRITEIIVEGVAGPKSCWPGHRKVGTQPGTGKNKGKRVNDCEKIGEQGVAEGFDDKFSVADKVEELVDQYRLYDKRGWTDLFTNLAGRKLEVAEIRREMEYASKFLQLLDNIRMRSDYRGQKDPRLDQELIDFSNQWLDLFNKATSEFKAISGQGVAEGSLEEYGDTKKGQKMLTKVQKRAVDRVVSKKADTDPKYAKKNADTADRAWERMTDKDLDEAIPLNVLRSKAGSGVKDEVSSRLKQNGPMGRDTNKAKQNNKPVEKGVAEGSEPQVGDAVYYGKRLVGWFKGYSEHGKIITEPDYEEMGDEYANRDVYWDPQDKITIRPEQGVAEDLDELHQEFDMIERIIEQIADQHAIDVDLVWEDLSVLSDDELYVFAVTSELINEDWQKANKRDKTDGMSQKAVNAYRRENPGSKLKTAVTTKPSKLKKGGKASKRRSSYCSRSRGQMKMHSISCSKTPDKAICKARRRWNC